MLVIKRMALHFKRYFILAVALFVISICLCLKWGFIDTSVVSSAYVNNADFVSSDIHTTNLNLLKQSAYYDLAANIQRSDIHKILFGDYKSNYDNSLDLDSVYYYFPILGHRIKKGENRIFLYRELTSADHYPQYNKISIYIPGNELLLKNRSIIISKKSESYLFYSKGSTGMYPDSCYGYGVAGRLFLKEVSASIITAELTFSARVVRYKTDEVCDGHPIVNFKKTIRFVLKDVNDLTFWDGKPVEYKELVDGLKERYP